jgi:cysteine desulfuration protein SufE
MRTIAEIRDDFQYLADSDFLDRLQYIAQLGDDLPPLLAAEMIDANKVSGCASQVWIVTERGEGGDPVMTFRGQSDASTVRGLIAILLSLFSGRRAGEIGRIDAEAVMGEFKLDEYVTARRTNGARAVIKRIKHDAETALRQAA